jgi:hypothetical protein
MARNFPPRLIPHLGLPAGLRLLHPPYLRPVGSAPAARLAAVRIWSARQIIAG